VHSACLSPVPALVPAKAEALPFLYEVRGFWEETGVVQGRISELGPRYRHFRFDEKFSFRRSDRIVTFSERLKKEVISRGKWARMPDDMWWSEGIGSSSLKHTCRSIGN